MALSRRQLLSGFAAASVVAAAGPALATEAPRWSPGLDNAPAEGFAEATMRLVSGRAPSGLAGQHYRNGPGWFRYADSATGHWFDGDGFVQRFAIADGQVRHSGQFVDTPKRRLEQREQRMIMPGFGTNGAANAPIESPDSMNAANTSVMIVGDELWALWEGGSPTRLDPRSLATSGVRPLRADLAGMPFTAHPKVEPNGRIWNLGLYGERCIIWRLSPTGAVEDAQIIRLPAPSYVHDWAVTERHLVIPLQPWIHDRMTAPYVDGFTWHGEQPFRVLVLDKNDYTNRRIYELPAMFFFHTGDAWEDADGAIRFDLCASANADFVTNQARSMITQEAGQSPSAELVLAVLHADGRAELQRSGHHGEFPQTDRRRQGQARDLVVQVEDRAVSKLGLMNWRTGAYAEHNFGADQMVQEHLFISKPGRTDENEAWLLGVTLNARERATELHVFDVASVSDGPVATWRSPYRAPLGFHSTWKYA
jgi:all-trans-8'-apo-beta-carotenal 15,15'-oxygenase